MNDSIPSKDKDLKRVLIIANRFPPLGGGSVIRILKFVKYLPIYGWLPVVLAPKSAHFTSVPDDYSLLDEIPAEVVVRRIFSVELDGVFDWLSKPIYALIRILFKEKQIKGKSVSDAIIWRVDKIRDIISKLLIPDKRAGWVPFAVINGLRAIRKYNIQAIFSTSPENSNHLIGLILKLTTRKPWIADFRELWEMPYSNTGRKCKILKNIDKFVRNKVTQNADRIITINEIMTEKMVQEDRLNRNKISNIPNGYDPDDFTDIIVRKKKQFWLVYTGGMGRGHNPENYFKALSILNESRYRDMRYKIKTIILGDKNEKIIKIMEKLRLHGMVEFKGFVTHKTACSYLKSADALLILIDEAADVEEISTGKIYEYLYAQKPILALSPECDATRLIEQFKAGVVVNPNNHEGIQDALWDMFKKYQRGELRINIDQQLLIKYDRSRLAGELAELLNDVGINDYNYHCDAPSY